MSRKDDYEKIKAEVGGLSLEELIEEGKKSKSRKRKRLIRKWVWEVIESINREVEGR